MVYMHPARMIPVHFVIVAGQLNGRRMSGDAQMRCMMRHIGVDANTAAADRHVMRWRMLLLMVMVLGSFAEQIAWLLVRTVIMHCEIGRVRIDMRRRCCGRQALLCGGAQQGIVGAVPSMLGGRSVAGRQRRVFDRNVRCGCRCR